MARLPWQKFDPPVTVIEHAIEYIETHSLVLCAIRPMSKAPYLFNWNDDSKGLSTAAAAIAELENTERGVGLLHGPSRTGAFDVDHLEYTKLAFAAFGIDYDAIMAGFPRIRSREGKDKIVFRLPAGFDPDNGKSKIKLTWPDPSGECDAKGRPHLITIFELRGGANQDVLPPSIHPNTEKPYTWAKAPWDFPGGIPAMDGALIAIWREWDRFERQFKAACPWATEPEFDSPPPPIARQVAGPGADVIGQYNAATPIHALLQQHGYKPKGKGRWLAPNSSTKIPGVVFLDEGRKVYSHHASDPLNNGHAHDAFSVFTTLEHNGDIAIAVKAAAMELGLPFLEAPLVDFTSLVRNGATKAKKEKPGQPRAVVSSRHFDPEPIPNHLLTIPGVLGEGVQWFLDTAVKPEPVYAVQSMLGVGATVIGRRYRTTRDNWSSLMLVCLGLSATGKEHIKHCIETVLAESGLGHLIGPSRYTSESGVLSELLEKPTHVCVMDEFGKVLEAAGNPRNVGLGSVMKYLMEIWGRSDGELRPVAYSTAGMRSADVDALNKRHVFMPSLTLVGLSTPDTFFDSLSSGNIRDGFVNRMLIAQCHAPRKPGRIVVRKPPPSRLIDWCKSMRPAVSMNVGLSIAPPGEMANMKPQNVVDVDFSRAAQQQFVAFDNWCCDRSNALREQGLDELFGRSNEIALRLALQVALSCGSTLIDSAHAEWAIDYVSYWTSETARQAAALIADGPTDAALKDVLRLVSRAGDKGMTDPELRKTSRNYAKLVPRMQSDVLSVLVADGLIERRDTKSAKQQGGKPRLAWVCVGQDD